MKPATAPKSTAVVFIDGNCVLCSGFAKFLIKQDKRKFFLLASLQGEYAKSNLPERERLEVSSIILSLEESLYQESDAVLRIFSYLDFPFFIISYFSFVPKIIRDFVYKQIAKRRYQLFGRYDSCPIPSSEEKERLVEGF